MPMPHKNADLALEVYQRILKRTETVENDNIGSNGFYLLGAILEGGVCQWTADEPIMRLLRVFFPTNHGVWKHVEVIN